MLANEGNWHMSPTSNTSFSQKGSVVRCSLDNISCNLMAIDDIMWCEHASLIKNDNVIFFVSKMLTN